MRMLPLLAASALLAGLAATGPAPAASDLGPVVSAAVARCWAPPPNASGSVTVHFELTRSGTVFGMPRVSGLASAGFAQSAITAVERCQPYRLPAARFSEWQHVAVKLSISPK